MKLKSSLEADIDRLQGELDSNKEKHTGMLGELTSQMEGMKKGEDKTKEDQAKIGEAHEKTKAEANAKDDVAMGELEDAVAKAQDSRGEAAKLRKEVAGRLAEMAVCGCEKPSLIGMKQVAAGMPSAKTMETANEIMDLQTKRNNLDQEVSDELRDFSAQQGALLGQKERLGVAQNLRASRMTTEADARKLNAGILEKHSGALARYAEAHKAHQTRAEADLKPLKEQVAELDMEMKKCGCGRAR